MEMNDKSGTQSNMTKKLAVSAVLIALGTAASFFTVLSLPFGGSITLFSMLFVSLIGYFYGVRFGIMAGVAYGLIQFALKPYFYVPVQMLLDYPLAFGALGLSGLFAGKKYGIITGYAVGVIGRYIFHVISGYVFFKEYTPDNMNEIVYAIVYNASYIAPEMIITIAVLLIPKVGMELKRAKRTVN